MGWSCVLLPRQRYAGRGRQDKEHAMPVTAQSAIAVRRRQTGRDILAVDAGVRLS